MSIVNLPLTNRVYIIGQYIANPSQLYPVSKLPYQVGGVTDMIGIGGYLGESWYNNINIFPPASTMVINGQQCFFAGTKQ